MSQAKWQLDPVQEVDDGGRVEGGKEEDFKGKTFESSTIAQ